jgi:Tfp pilus assembly protein PilV
MKEPRSGGFTILEVLVASMILVFVIASSAGLLLATMTQGTASRRVTDAATLAQQELEIVRDLDYANITSAIPRQATVGAYAYTVERVVSVNDPVPNTKRITVTVSWTMRGPRTYVAETIFTSLRE